MTKADMIDSVVRLGFTRKEASELVELFIGLICETLRDGKDVKLSGFGNFVVRSKKTRLGRNPKTGDALQIRARRVVTFKASQLLKAAVRQ